MTSCNFWSPATLSWHLSQIFDPFPPWIWRQLWTIPKLTSCGLLPFAKYSRDLWLWSRHPSGETVSVSPAVVACLFAEIELKKMWCEIFYLTSFHLSPFLFGHDFVLSLKCKQKFQKVSMCKVFKWTLLNICSVVELCTWNSNTKKFPFFFCCENVNIKMLK